MHGYLLVFDPTRLETLEFALRLRETIEARSGFVLSLLIASKANPHADRQVSAAQLETLKPYGPIQISSKTGDGVEASFATLARLMLEGRAED